LRTKFFCKIFCLKFFLILKDCVSDSGASAASSKKSDDSIAVGESAISPIASPKKQAENEVKMKDYGEEDDDDIICID